jgi:hypothetical protein
MKHPLPLLIALCAGTLPCFAQVEPRLAGDWHESSPAGHFSMNISTNGRYTRHHNGQTESGKITAHDGNWQLHSDSGKVESGRFSMLGGNLKFSGGSMPSALSKGGASHSPMYTPPVVHTQSHVPAAVQHSVPPNQSTAPVQNLQAVFQNNPPVSVDVQPSIQQNVPAQMPAAQPPSLKATIKNKLIQTINSIPTFNSNQSGQPIQSIPSVNSIPGLSSIPGANHIPNIPNIPNIPYVPTQVQQPLKQAIQQIPQSQTYHSMYGNQNQNLPGYAPQQDLQPSSTSTSATTTSQTGPTANQNNNAGYSKRIVTPYDFDKWSAVQQAQPRSASGLQRVPKGGYIPVMKDGKARRYFQGR